MKFWEVSGIDTTLNGGVASATMRFDFSATYVALWLVAIAEGLLVLGVLQRLEKVRLLMERGNSFGDRLSIGSSAPEFSISDLSGKPLGLPSLNGQAGTVLFLSSGCSVCKTLVDSLASTADALPPTVALCQGDKDGCAAFSNSLAATVQVGIDVLGETAVQYGVSVFPAAVILGADGTVRGYSYPKDVEDLKRAFVNSFAGDNRMVISVPDLSATSAVSSIPK